MVDENIKLRIKTDPLFALEVFNPGKYYRGEDNEYLQQFAFTKLVSIGVISPKDFQLDFHHDFDLVDFHVFNPSYNLCRDLLQNTNYKSVVIACIVLSYNDLFYRYKDDVFYIMKEDSSYRVRSHYKEPNEEYYYYACKVNNTEIMKSEYRDGFKKASGFDYSTYIFN